MLLVADKNESVVRYALAGTTQPIAVSRYDLSPAEQAALPAEDALARGRPRVRRPRPRAGVTPSVNMLHV